MVKFINGCKANNDILNSNNLYDSRHRGHNYGVTINLPNTLHGLTCELLLKLLITVENIRRIQYHGMIK